MIGIYKYTNTINNKVYIGQSIDIAQRKNAHKYAYQNENAGDYNSRFHQAIRKHGFENFTFVVLQEVSEQDYNKEFLNELEKQYIAEYDSFNFDKGYNATLGGEYGVSQAGEKNGRAKLSQQDVENIRKMYGNQIPFRDAYPLYQDKITKRGFQKVWWNDTWKKVSQDVYTEENIYFHKHEAKKLTRDEVHNSLLTSQEVELVKQAKLTGVSIKDYYNKYIKDKMSFSGFEKVWYGR